MTEKNIQSGHSDYGSDEELISTIKREIVKATEKEGSPCERTEIEKEVKLAFHHLNENQASLDNIVSSLLNDGIGSPSQLIKHLGDISMTFPSTPECTKLAGLLWSSIFNRSDEPGKKEILDSFVSEPGHRFFLLLNSLPEFILRVPFSAKELAEYLKRVRERTGNDMASAGLWNALSEISEKTPSVALEILAIWRSEELDDNLVSMAASILGSVRSASWESIEVVDQDLRKHPDCWQRKVYLRSWISKDSVVPLSDAEILNLLHCPNDQGDRDEVFNVLRCILPLDLRSEISFRAGVDWIHENFQCGGNDFQRHHIVELAQKCDQRCETMGLSPLRDLIPSFLPIPEEDTMTWHFLDTLMTELLQRDAGQSNNFLNLLLAGHRESILNAFDDRDLLSHFLRELSSSDSKSYLVECLLSSFRADERTLGRALFTRLRMSEISEEKLRRWSDDWVALLLIEVGLEFLEGESTFNLLQSLSPRVETGKEPLRRLFVETLSFHMINLPGGVLDSARKDFEQNENSLLGEAIIIADKYFEDLRICQSSEVNSIQIPGLRRASRLLNVKRSREMSDAVEKGSVFLSMISKSYALYGGHRWRTYIDGNLGKSSEMKGYSTSMEIPRFYVMHPDQAARRRRQSLRLISEIEAKEAARLEQEKVSANQS